MTQALAPVPGKRLPAQARPKSLLAKVRERWNAAPAELKPTAPAGPMEQSDEATGGSLLGQTGTMGSGIEPAVDCSQWTGAMLSSQVHAPIKGAIVMGSFPPSVPIGGTFPQPATGRASSIGPGTPDGNADALQNSSAGGNLTNGPQPVRKNTVPDPLLRRTTKLPLAGTFGQKVGPGGTIEPATRQPIGMDEGDTAVSDMMGMGADGQPVTNAGWNGRRPADDLTALSPARSFPADALRTFHASFPFVPVAQLPTVNRALVLLATIGQEIQIPRGAVAFRLEWTGRASGANDLWMSNLGLAEVPTAALVTAAGSNDQYNAAALNPDTTKLYFCKTITSLSFLCANNCIVSLQFYMQAG